MERIYKYYPGDFGELTSKVLHIDLVFDVYDDHTKVNSDLKIRTLENPIDKLELNCKNLEIISVGCDKYDINYNYRKSENILEIIFDKAVPADTEVVISTETICRPTKNILEGLYYDATPPGAPPQQITQCQQWGFQRIVPCIDDMAAKCTYRTTIIADEKYTNLITNGDIVEEMHSIDGGRSKIVYDNSITPMATYLFFLGVGTYKTFKKEFEYPDGHIFDLELLVPPESDSEIAQRAIDILYDSVMWVYLFTGPEQYQDLEKRKEILEITRKRDTLKMKGGSEGELAEIRRSLKELVETIKTGYKYTGTVYREIGMQNSDFGGMENVGNTTITTNRIMPFLQITDPAFEYMTRVKVHEYYHNLNGSEVTGKSPFEIWLNEAVTVHIEEQFHSFLFGESYSRLKRVLELLAPGIGTFALDSGAASMSIIPEGFNDPNDLITSVTYVKAPEFVRMVETLMGKEAFAKALDDYHNRFKHENASTLDWLESMENVSGQKFKEMADVWLKQTNFPILHVSTEYDESNRNFTFKLEQEVPEDYEVWEFPFWAALVDENGNDVEEFLERIVQKKSEIIIKDVDRPAFVSLNREYSFYGKVVYDASEEELLLQVKKDGDVINRFGAFYKLVDGEKNVLLNCPEAQPSRQFIELYGDLLKDEWLMQEVGGQFLTIFESVEDERLAHRYQALYDVKQRLFKALANEHRDLLMEMYHIYNNRSIESTWSLEEKAKVIKNRQVKNNCLTVLATLDTPEVHQMCKEQFNSATCATDKLTAFALYLKSSAPDRLDVLEEFKQDSRGDLVSWEAFLQVVGNNSSSDAIELIQKIESSESFRIEQTNDQRALYLSFGRNRKLSLQTENGRAYLKSIMIKLAGVNEYNTVNILNNFANIDLMETEYHVPLVSVLVELMESIDSEKTPSVYNRIRKLLLGAPSAVAEYEKIYGEIKGK